MSFFSFVSLIFSFFCSLSPDSCTHTLTLTGPTMQPIPQPTMAPTTLRTGVPTFVPSERPTRQPSIEPSRRPTIEPSARPTIHPTLAPSRRPTIEPSARPTKTPTRTPTARPTTASPTKRPTPAPSARPSKAPTREPSVPPTFRPSREPTIEPTFEPTVRPTNRPTREPTFRPTNRPTVVRTSNPTPAPVANPTPSPVTPTRDPTPAPVARPPTSPPVNNNPLGQAHFTTFQSYPQCCSDSPNYNPFAPVFECVFANGCAHQGNLPAYYTDDNTRGHVSLEFVQSHDLIAFFDRNDPNGVFWRERYAGKTIHLIKQYNGRVYEFDAIIANTCSDSDCGGCCSRNAGNLGYLVDMEYYTVLNNFGTLDAANGEISFYIV